MLYGSFFNRARAAALWRNGSPIFDLTTVRAVDPEYVNVRDRSEDAVLEDCVQLNVAALQRLHGHAGVSLRTGLKHGASRPPSRECGVSRDHGRRSRVPRPVRRARPEPRRSGISMRLTSDYVVQEGDSTFGNPTIDFSGNRLVGAPETSSRQCSGRVHVRSPAGRGSHRASSTYSSRVDFDSSNNPLLAQGLYSVVNARCVLENIADQPDVTACPIQPHRGGICNRRTRPEQISGSTSRCTARPAPTE